MVDDHPAWPAAADVLALLRQARAAETPPLHKLSVAAARRRIADARSALPPGPAVRAVDEHLLGPNDVRARLYRPGVAPSLGTIIYAHGGGWVVGGVEESDSFSRHLAIRSGFDVVTVGYRRAPEQRFPGAVDDVDEAVAWVRAQRPGLPVALVGDSAGGNLVAAVARRWRDRRDPAIVLQVLVYPVTDADLTRPSYQEFGVAGMPVSTEDMAWFWKLYCPDEEQRTQPDASPLRAGDLTGLPPALVLIADHDVLRDEGLAYAHALRAADVDTTVDRYEQMIHGFATMIGVLDAADAAVDSVAAACAAALSGSGSPTAQCMSEPGPLDDGRST